MSNQKKRAIDNAMKDAFLKGELQPILDAVKTDDTLDLELRGDSVNVYYRGGSLFKIYSSKGQYKIYFNKKYCINDTYHLEAYPDVDKAVRDIPLYKQAMDWWFNKHPKYEREFEQVIVRENNNLGNISRGTDYYIIDIEYANQIACTSINDKTVDIEADYDNEGANTTAAQTKGARFDMVAVKWLSDGATRKNLRKASLALIEVKYGSGAMKGKSGIGDHLKDFQHFMKDEKNLEEFRDDMTEVFKQKWELGLFDGLKLENQVDDIEIKISTDNPEVIFIFANHDPDSTILENIWKDADIQNELANCKDFKVLTAHSSSMGYCLYADKMEQIQAEEA